MSKPPTTFTTKRTTDYMREHLSEPLDIHSLCKVAYLSPWYFSRLFTRMEGTSPMRFLRGLRIERAKELLRDTNMRVGDIVVEVGYGSNGTFYNMFRNTTGVSPSEYRRQSKSQR